MDDYRLVIEAEIAYKEIIMAGALALTIDLNANPSAFQEGINVDWATHDVNGKMFRIASEGTTLLAYINPGTPDEEVAVSSEVDVSSKDTHHIMLRWDEESIKLDWNGERVDERKI